MIFLWMCCSVIAAVASQHIVNETSNKVTILGLFAKTPLPAAQAYNQVNFIRAQGNIVETAVRLALSDINAMPHLLNGVKLEMLAVDTMCDPATAVWSMTNCILKQPKPVMILGPPCDESAKHMIGVTDKHTNILTVSYEAENLQLINYSSSFLANPTYMDLFKALHELLIHFNWNSICLIKSVHSSYIFIAENLLQFLNQDQIQSNHKVTVIDSVTTNHFNFTSSYCRIYVVVLLAKQLTSIFCDAFRAGTTGEGYQWIYIGIDLNTDIINTFKTSCDDKELLQAMQNIISIDFAFFDTQERKDFENKLNHALHKEGIVETISEYDIQVSAQSYDAVWIIALGINASMEQADFVLNDYLPLQNPEVSAKLKRGFESVKFQGASRNIHFSSARHYVQSDVVISQWQGNHVSPIAIIYVDGINDWSYNNNSFKWESGTPPIDSPQTVVESLPLPIQMFFYLLSLIGCTLVCIMLCINLYFRHTNIIKASSPCMNNIILVGIFVGFLSIPCIALIAAGFLSDGYRSAFCNIFCWLVNLSFTIAFSAILIKTWRVHMIFRNPWEKKRILKDPILILIVIGMALVDSAVLITWTALVPLRLEYKTINTPMVITKIAVCNNEQGNLVITMVLLLLTYKLVLIIFGGFLAYKTRNIKIHIFNDSKSIGIAIYGLIVTAVPGIFVSIISFVTLNTIWTYLFINLTIFLCLSLIICTVFLPKLFLLFKSRKSLYFKPSYAIDHSSMVRKSIVSSTVTLQSVDHKKSASNVNHKWMNHHRSDSQLLANKIIVRNPLLANTN